MTIFEKLIQTPTTTASFQNNWYGDVIAQIDTTTWTVVSMKVCGRLWSVHHSVYMQILLHGTLVQN